MSNPLSQMNGTRFGTIPKPAGYNLASHDLKRLVKDVIRQSRQVLRHALDLSNHLLFLTYTFYPLGWGGSYDTFYPEEFSPRFGLVSYRALSVAEVNS